MDYFPYMVQDETLVVDAIELYAASGRKLNRHTIATTPANSLELRFKLNS